MPCLRGELECLSASIGTIGFRQSGARGPPSWRNHFLGLRTEQGIMRLRPTPALFSRMTPVSHHLHPVAALHLNWGGPSISGGGVLVVVLIMVHFPHSVLLPTSQEPGVAECSQLVPGPRSRSSHADAGSRRHVRRCVAPEFGAGDPGVSDPSHFQFRIAGAAAHRCRRLTPSTLPYPRSPIGDSPSVASPKSGSRIALPHRPSRYRAGAYQVHGEPRDMQRVAKVWVGRFGAHECRRCAILAASPSRAHILS
jgi:hypothetical protein